MPSPISYYYAKYYYCDLTSEAYELTRLYG